MKTVEMFKDQYDGSIHETREECEKSEYRNKFISDAFAFVVPKSDEKWAKYSGGGIIGGEHIQRAPEYRERMAAALANCLNEFHPGWAEKRGEPKFDAGSVLADYMLGRILNDIDMQLYGYWCDLWCICQTCHQQWEQQYNTNHCPHPEFKP
jgi:hypothetical protein